MGFAKGSRLLYCFRRIVCQLSELKRDQNVHNEAMEVKMRLTIFSGRK